MKSLFSRLWLSATFAVILLFASIWQWLQFSHEFTSQQVQQSLHKELAAHMAHINPLLSKGVTSDAALKEAFHDFMLLGPSFEIYTLDTSGKVVAYDAKKEKIKSSQVDIQYIEQFIAGQELPLLGTDPRSETKQKIFSATRLLDQSGQHTGYLYVIIGGEIFDSWQTLISQHQAPKQWSAAIAFGILAALIIFTLLLKYFTAPLARLEYDLGQVASQSLSEGVALPGDYRGSREINQLSQHIDKLLAELSLQHQTIAGQQQAKHEFLLHLSHDLKTPLTSLQGYIETWLVTPPNERQAEWIEIAANSGKTLQQLLAQLLELAALENGQVHASVQQVSLRLLLEELQQSFAPRAETQGIQLDFQLPHDRAIQTDPHLLKRVISNLVDNAIRYTPSGGKISIRHHSKNGQEWLDVVDTGSGMHQHELSALQQMSGKPIRYEDNAALPQLGVGLAIVRQLLGLLQYPIEIESQPGKGSQFRIQLV
ncbi:sensor histidine kinase [Shewanella gelidii]|uniref:histidine kinase n=1 Tax=Shewanella gelidii TaxID=1642821 RepID=A0A917JQX6_9GAMM|nr:HAMP domain-containing sensor histidine kinase [Shewanella gelidii]MCL1099549.1 HAMP domain-containing histidine kinase [Shewanella gelidii]GGI80731.1 hypothetical protein GCM10009332_17610 [Shewanella gelidii]